MGRWQDAVSPVRDGEARRTPKGGLTGLLKQSVAGLVGQSQDPTSPGKGKRLSWFGLGSRRSVPEDPPGADDIEGGSGGGSESSTAPLGIPGSTAEEFAVASQLLEGLYGKRLEASKAMDILGTVPEISWLVECYCMTPAQPGWRKSKTAPGDVPLFADEASGKVYEAMPCIRHYMRMAELALTARNLPEKADAAAAQLHHYVQSLRKEVKTTEAAWTGPHEDSESQGEYYHNPSTGVSIWENPTFCTKFILSVAEQLQESEAFPQSVWKAGRREDGRLPKSMGKALEDPWTSLDKLEAMSIPTSATQDMDIEAFLGSLQTTGDPSSPSSHGPVQLVATSPKGPPRVKDVRSWTPQVPRFDAGKLSTEVSSTSRSPSRKRDVPKFRSEAQGSDKVGDVRGWAPTPQRFDTNTLEAAKATREGALRTSAEAKASADVEAAPVPPEVEEHRVFVAPDPEIPEEA